MAIGANPVRFSYTGDGTTVSFSVPSPFYSGSDLTVLLAGAITSAYTVTGGAGATGVPAAGAVLFSTAPASGVSIVIIISVPLSQNVTLANGVQLPPLTIDQALDRAIFACQRLSDLIGRAIVAPDGDIAPVLQLPAAAARAGMFPGFDANGNLNMAASVPAGSLSQALFNSMLAASFATGSGSVQLTAGGFTSSLVTYPLNYWFFGSLVVCAIAPGNAASNATSFTLSGVPAAIQPPTVIQVVPLYAVQNNGTVLTSGGAIQIENGGTWNVLLNGSATGWTASGVKGITGFTQSFAYLLQ